MTGCILIEECVIEKMPALGDGGTDRHKRDFAQASGAFIGVNQFLKDGFILFCIDLDDLSVFKGHAEIFDQTSPVAERKCGRDRSICTVTVRQRKNFLCGHIGSEYNAVLRQDCALIHLCPSGSPRVKSVSCDL